MLISYYQGMYPENLIGCN